jgi:hypothetical protein
MSDYRVEKRREAADVTLITGATLSGFVFLAGSSHLHAGPERIGDLFKMDAGFFPFECNGEISLINRTHVLKVALPPQMIEAEIEPGYDVAPRYQVKLLLTTGEMITGHVVVFLPPEHERLSDYARMDERFRYIELPERTLLVNAAHIVALTEVEVEQA